MDLLQNVGLLLHAGAEDLLSKGMEKAMSIEGNRGCHCKALLDYH